AAKSSAAMAGKLQINLAGKAPVAHAASEEQVRKLIEELLDESESPASGFDWALRAERMREQEFVRMTVDEPDSVQQLWSWTKMTKPKIWLLRPMLKRDAIRLLRMSEDALAAAKEDTYSAAMARMGSTARIKRKGLGLDLVSAA